MIFSSMFACKAQEIKGIWQINTPEVGSTLDQCYHFKDNGEFEYHPSGYDGLCRINTIGGKFEMRKDTICFIVEYLEECLNGTIERSTITTKNDSWAINDDCEVSKTFFPVKETWCIPCKFLTNEKLQLGSNIYYLTQEE